MANVEEKKSVSTKLSQFIISKSKIILIVCAVIVVVVVVTGIATAVNNNAQQKWMTAIETAETDYTDWKALTVEDSDRDLEAEELEIELLAIVDGAKNSYPQMKATFLLGSLSFELKDYTEAASYFDSVQKDYADTYLAPVALMNNAVALEMLNKNDEALDRYQRLVDTYAAVSPEASHAMFSIGRIYEGQGNLDLSKAVYEQLIAEYETSEWAKLAQVRLITID